MPKKVKLKFKVIERPIPKKLGNGVQSTKKRFSHSREDYSKLYRQLQLLRKPRIRKPRIRTYKHHIRVPIIDNAVNTRGRIFCAMRSRGLTGYKTVVDKSGKNLLLYWRK